MRWLDGITDSMEKGTGSGLLSSFEACRSCVRKGSPKTLCSSPVEIPTDEGPWQAVDTKKESSGMNNIHITM